MTGSSATPELPPLIVIGGATATGKTALAIELATRIEGAEIVSADSRQVYRGMDIGTAKPTVAEQAAAPHHCLDLADPDERFTAAAYRRHALSALAGIAARGGVALLVGGTGLYLRAVARDLPLDGGDVDAGLRAELEDRLQREGLATLVDELVDLDATGATLLDLHNPRRVVRALERARLSGAALPPPARGYPQPLLWLVLALEPEIHRNTIAERVEQHFEAGLLDEADRLRQRFPEDLRAFSAMGYGEAFDVLAGRTSIEQAKASDAQRTWAYARRQRSWFRSESDAHSIEAGAAAPEQAQSLIAPFLREIDAAAYAERR